MIEVGRIDSNVERIFFVRDNGVGVDPRFTDKLFRPFERLHEAEAFPGLGISLARVRRIVSRHGGVVQAGAGEGGGAEFGFVLPPGPSSATGVSAGAHE